jgi:hypothetical protein
MNRRFFRTTALLVSCLLPTALSADVLGSIGIETRIFPASAADPQQGSESFSAVLEPEWFRQWNEGNDSINIKAFYRHDSLDKERSHGDFRELYWQHVGDYWELSLGINTIFWGVTESQHLVDIINQTDFVEAADGEDKLGQPMLHLTLIRDWGVVDAFVLPSFRPRQFAGAKGRLRSIPLTENTHEQYQSDKGDDHIDFALRWSHYLGDWSLGLSWFQGTSREPLYNVAMSDDAVVLKTFYPLISQSGVDVQYISGDWLWKLEAIYRRGLANSPAPDLAASTTGFEYTSTSINNSYADLGFLMEYSYDSRDNLDASAFQNELFIGSRLALNDIASTAVLFGIIQDLDETASRSAFIEASTRMGDGTRISVEIYHFHSQSIQDPLYSIRRDSYIEFALAYYF